MGKREQRCLLLWLFLSGLVRSSAAFVFWTAVVDISYVDYNNATVKKYCECGLFGRNSDVTMVYGNVALPVGDLDGCGSGPVYSHNNSTPWIALVKRGNCTFSEKIIAAKRQGAVAVVVFNMDGTDNGTNQMSHPEVEDIVAIMIGNIQGMDIVKLLRNETVVVMTIKPGKPHGPWIDTYWLYLLSIAFFIVTAASVTYFIFLSASRLYRLNRHRRNEQRLKSEAKRAIRRLQVRTLQRDDEETNSESHMCAVCIESYNLGDVVTVLTCDHIFHKTCIEPWLLDKRTCPMCKCDILKALGVEDESKESISAQPPPDATVITVTGGEAMYEVPLTDPGSPNLERPQHHYDNRAFEGDSEAVRG